MNEVIIQVITNALGLGLSAGLFTFLIMWGAKSVLNIFRGA